MWHEYWEGNSKYCGEVRMLLTESSGSVLIDKGV